MAVSLYAGASPVLLHFCPTPNPTTRDPCADAATPPHYPPASQDMAILRCRKHNILQAFTRKMHSASILIRSPPRRSRTTRRLYSSSHPNMTNNEVLASSVGAFATFASMDKVFAHHKGTLPRLTLHKDHLAAAPVPLGRGPSHTASLPAPSRRPRPLASALQAARNGGGTATGAEQRRVHELANGGNATSGGRAEAYPRIVRTAPGAPTWPPAPAARTLDLRVHFASAIEARWPPLAGPAKPHSVESDVFRFRSGLNAITWLTSAVDAEMHWAPLTTVSTVLSIS
ncbi:hypothetical protein C8J57DRAFT_1661609 [Mycena rebaudengoi]|nr:hypothetical protein C8J57DRAFT_1661609 [Mycena rebaudengoi]